MSKDVLPIPLLNEVLVDLTNFLARPLRTGIQRYFTEIVSTWPAGQSLLPFTLEDGQAIAVLDPAIFAAMSGYMRAENQSRTDLFEQRIRHFRDNPLRRVAIADLIAAKAILLPEVTYDPRQLDFYRRAMAYFGEKVVAIVYDFVPWLHPELYPDLDFGDSRIDDYVGVLQGGSRFAFISHKTKKDAEERVLRRRLPDSLVLGGGADGLSVEGPVTAAPPAIPEFVMVGTVQQRKQHFTVLDVCEAMWRDGARFFLTFVGAAGDFLTHAERERLDTLARTSPWFRWEQSPLDSELVDIMRRATATIYASIEEGLGLPVLESLWLTVPVIASHTLPSLDFIPNRGIRLADMTRPGTLADAIKAFLAPGFAESARAEIDRAALPTWRGVAARLQAWIDQLPGFVGQGHVSARRRLEMIAAIHDLRRVPPSRLVYAAFTALYGRAPTGAELAVRSGRSGGSPGEVVARMAAAEGSLSPAERSAWLMSIEAAQALPADFSFVPPDAAPAASLDRAIALLRPLLGCPDAPFLTLAYQAALGRDPDPPGEADFRRFLDGHAHEARWARGFAVKSLAGSEEGIAHSGDAALPDRIEDLLLIDVFSNEEVACLEHVADGIPSRWLFARLLELRTLAFLRLATALFERRRVSEVQVENPPREFSRAEKLDFLRTLYRGDERAARLIEWVATASGA